MGVSLYFKIEKTFKDQSDMNLNSLSLELVYLTLCFAVFHYGKLKKKWEEA